MSQLSVETLQNFIDNEFVPPCEEKYFDNLNPATSQVIARVSASTEKDVDIAVQSAKKAQKEWNRLGASQRAVFLRAIADEIEKRLDEFAEMESRDNGKPLALAKAVDIPRACWNFRFFAGRIEHDSTECHQMNDAINYTYRMPLGVCGLITPWNLPLYLLSWKIAPAIACGNTVVCKPSELTPMTATLLGTVVQKVKLPKGVINIVHGYGKDAGAALCTHPDVAAISFTGGTVTGAKISAMAAPLCKKLGTELGGKNATVVFSDCEFDKTVPEVCRSAFANQGQICLCGSRIFVEKSIANKFIDALIDATQKTYSSSIGDPNTCRTGSLISLEHRAKVESYVELAQKEGGKIVLGGHRPKDLKSPFDKGAFYMPTIIVGLPFNSRCATEEIFGPVVTVHEFESESEVVDMCNSVKYGLAGSVWTSNLKRGHRVAQAIESGMIWVNCWMKRDLRVPFGGVKESGLGREGGHYSMDFWTHQKNICVQLD